MTSLRCGIRKKKAIHMNLGFPDGAGVKNSPASAGDKRDLGLIPGSGRSPGEGHGTPLQHSCLGNPMDRGAWWATVHGVEKGQTRLKHVCTHSQMNLLIKQKQTHRLRELSYGCWGEGWGDGMDRYTLLYLNWITNKDLLWASLVAQRIKRLPTMQETRVRSLGLGRSPGGMKWQPTPVFLPGEFQGQRSLVGYSPWGLTELDTTE